MFLTLYCYVFFQPRLAFVSLCNLWRLQLPQFCVNRTAIWLRFRRFWGQGGWEGRCVMLCNAGWSGSVSNLLNILYYFILRIYSIYFATISTHLQSVILNKFCIYSWIKIDQLDVTRYIISLFTVQHVSNVSTFLTPKQPKLILALGTILYPIPPPRRQTYSGSEPRRNKPTTPNGH